MIIRYFLFHLFCASFFVSCNVENDSDRDKQNILKKNKITRQYTQSVRYVYLKDALIDSVETITGTETYDKNGNTVESEYLIEGIKKKCLYVENEKKEDVLYNKNNEIIGKKLYERDSKGLLKQTLYYDSLGELSNKNLFERGDSIMKFRVTKSFDIKEDLSKLTSIRTIFYNNSGKKIEEMYKILEWITSADFDELNRKQLEERTLFSYDSNDNLTQKTITTLFEGEDMHIHSGQITRKGEVPNSSTQIMFSPVKKRIYNYKYNKNKLVRVDGEYYASSNFPPSIEITYLNEMGLQSLITYITPAPKSQISAVKRFIYK